MQTRYVDPDSTAGGDGTTNALTGANRAYVSLSAWESARQAVLSDSEEVICESNGGSHTADTTAVTIAGWTTTAANFISIKTSAGGRHDGKWNTGKYRLSSANATAILIQEDYVRLEGLQIEVNAANASNQFGISVSGITATNNEIRISATLARTHANASFTTNALSVSDADTILKVWNSAFQHRGGTSSGSDRCASLTTAFGWLYNCIFFGGQTGIRITGGTNVAKNVVSCGSGSNDYSVTAGTLTCTFCVSEDATCPAGTGNQTNVTVASMAFTDAANTDFHIGSGSSLENQGTDLSADADLAFSDDIDGQTRSGTWDIGADEIATTTQTISPSGIASGEAFGTARVNLQILPSGIASAEVVPSPRVNQQVRPGGIASEEAFGTPTISVGAPPQTISPPSIASEEVFGTATVNQQIRPSSITSEETFGTATINQQIRPPSIASLETFGTPTVSAGSMPPQTVSPPSIPSEEQFGTARINQQIRIGVPVTEAVTWTNVVGASNVGNALTKTAADGVWGNSGAISNESIPFGDGYLEFNPSQTNKSLMVGLGDGTDAGQNFAELIYAFFFGDTGNVQVYESGAPVTAGIAYTTSDVLRIEVLNGVVYYKKNGSVVHTSGVAPSYPLYVDTSLFSIGGIISGLQLTHLVDSGIASLEAFGTAKVNQQIRPGRRVLEAVTWTNVVNATNAGNTLTKTSADAWDAGAISTQSLQFGDGYIEFSPAQIGLDHAIGFGDAVDTDQNHIEIIYGFYLGNGGFGVEENGVLVTGDLGAYATSDVFRIEVVNGVVRYRRNGTLLHTSSIPVVYPLFVDTAMHFVGTVISGVMFESLVEGGIISLEAFGIPTISTGPPPPQTILPAGIASLESFGIPRVNQHIFVTAIPSGEAFGSPTISVGTPVIWTSFGAPFLYSFINWYQPAEFFLEAFFKSDVGGIVKARLFNVTDSVPLLNSEIQTVSTSYVRVRSGSLVLTDGKEYRVQFGASPGITGAFKMAKLLNF